MIRLRIALGVASSLVAVAALTIVFAGTGEAQGNVKETNVVVTNTPLPVTGNLNAVVSGNVSANIINPANNPVLIRDVDAPGAKEPWQELKFVSLNAGDNDAEVEFSQVPVGKLLVIEHVNLSFQPNPTAGRPEWFVLQNTDAADSQFFLTQHVPSMSLADAATKYHVSQGATPRVRTVRADSTGNATLVATLTGYLVNYP
jgi:hypothetical protein